MSVSRPLVSRVVLLVALGLWASGCRPVLEGAACSEHTDCPRSQYCEEGLCREGDRLTPPDADLPPDAGDVPPVPDAGVAGCDVGNGCSVALSAPGVLTVGEPASVSVTVQNEDGVPVPGVEVTLSATGSGAVLSVAGGTTDGSGVLAATLGSEVAGRITVRASAGGRHARAEVSFEPGLVASGRSGMAVSATPLRVGQAAVVEVWLADAFGNPLPGVDVGLSAAGPPTVFGAASGQTDGAGRFRTSVSAAQSGVRQLTATAAGLALTSGIQFEPGPAASLHSSLSVPAQPLAAGQQGTLRAVVRDAWGNPVPQQPLVLQVSGQGNALGASAGTTDGAGVFETTFLSTRAERKRVQLEAGAALVVEHLDVVAAEVSEARSSLATGTGTGRLVAGAVTPVAVELRDGFGNPVAGAEVVLAISGQANALGSSSGRTGPGGIWTSTVSSTKAEAKVLTAAAGGKTWTAGLEVVPGPAAYGASSLEVAPANLVAGAGATVRVTVRDVHGNPVEGHRVSLASSGSENLFGAAEGTTDVLGQFSTPFTSTRAEAKRLVATLEQGYGEARLVVAPGAPSAARSSLEVAPRAGIPDGQAPRPVHVQVRDAHGNPVPGTTVSLAMTGGAQVQAPAAPSDAEGRTSGAVWSSTPCVGTLTAEAGGVLLGAVEVSFQYPDARQSLLEAPSAAAADGTPITVRVTVVDGSGHVLPGTPVTLTYGGVASPVPTTVAAGPEGVASFQLSSSAVTSGFLGARAAGVLLEARPWLAFGNIRPLTGTVEGLGSEGLVLAAPGLGELSVPAGATTFTFAQGLLPGRPWALAVQQQPSGGHCRVEAGTSPAVRCHPRWRRVVALAGATLALDDAGGLWAWGRNDEGQLGLGDVEDRDVPVRVGTGYAAVAAGAAHVLAVKEDGSLWAWGRNDEGQLGTGDLLPRRAPAWVGTGYVAAEAGDSHSVALDGQGHLWAWGGNAHGQLGLGDGPSRAVPGDVGGGYAEVASGGAHVLARRLDGTVWAWGRNDDGQLGLGDALSRSLPEPLGLDAVQVVAGGETSAALRSDASLWTWGANPAGQLGLGDVQPRLVPSQVGTGFRAVVLGARHAVAVGTDATAWAWGENADGQLGTGDTAARLWPAFLAAGVLTAAAGEAHTVLVMQDGATRVMGSSAHGALGLGPLERELNPVPVPGHYTALAAGAAHSLGLGADGSLWAWGENASGQLGVGDTTSRLRPAQVGVGYVAVAAGPAWSLGLKSDGTLWAWGDNVHGQLGQGDVLPRLSPVRVGAGFRDFSAGGSHALGVKSDGTLWAWGANAHGQLGLSDTGERWSPTLVTSGFRAVAAGESHSLALAADGVAWAFGANGSGQLGVGGFAQQTSPVPLGVVFQRLFAGGRSSHGLTSSGVLWSWGVMDAGQPLEVPTEWRAGVAGVGVGGDGRHLVIVGLDGVVSGLGRNREGQLGLGDGVDRGSFTGIGQGFREVAAGHAHSLLLSADGVVWATGAAGAGQLGTGRGARILDPTEGP